MKCKTVDDVLKAMSVDDVFTNNPSILKAEYREYLKMFHPDFHNGEMTYQEATSKIVMLYEKATDLIARGAWEESNKIRLSKPNGKTLVVSYLKEYSFELGKMYLCNNHIVYVIPRQHKKYYDNYVTSIRFSCPRDMMQSIDYALPHIVQNFENNDECVIIIKREYGCVPLSEVWSNFNGRIPIKHTAWMISRLLNLACFLSYNNIVHNGIDINSCFVDIARHGIMLYGGWWYTRPVDTKMIGVSSEVYDVMPPSAKRNKKSKKSTDMECVKMLGIKLLGCTSKISDATVPSQIMTWLRTGSGEYPPTEMKRWEMSLEAAFGKRTFTKMNPEMGKIKL